MNQKLLKRQKVDCNQNKQVGNFSSNKAAVSEKVWEQVLSELRARNFESFEDVKSSVIEEICRVTGIESGDEVQSFLMAMIDTHPEIEQKLRKEFPLTK